MEAAHEPAWVPLARVRAKEEGLSVVNGDIWYTNPEGLNGTGAQYSGTAETGVLLHYAGRIQDVGLSKRTHLKIKVDGRWFEVTIALGEILDCFSIPHKRYGTTD